MRTCSALNRKMMSPRKVKRRSMMLQSISHTVGGSSISKSSYIASKSITVVAPRLVAMVRLSCCFSFPYESLCMARSE
ncbi:unnamed protein product [Caenorhabditis brenneri]